MSAPGNQSHSSTDGASEEAERLDNKETRKKSWRKYYELLEKGQLGANLCPHVLHKKFHQNSTLSAKARRLLTETPEEAEERKLRHRLAAAKYREANNLKIRIAARMRRLCPKFFFNGGLRQILVGAFYLVFAMSEVNSDSE
ncbi:hypothetical protein CVT26_002275 [Gymnopilus dilepis]|uniref:Uncharacterized protein n=1 Tax=Gymnopilus dilepis TaxID=231916 RepID=A0A409YN60_9AGAR|nr:hypothetical protein CVT26_002275 [Gymnopilus dilepis]